MSADWKSLRPTLALYGVGMLSLLLAIFVGAWVVIAIAATSQGAPLFEAAEGEPATGLFLALGPPLVAMFLYSTGYILFVRLRYNSGGLERTLLGKSVFHPWETFEKLGRHPLFGPRLQLKSGGGVVVWDSLRGFETFAADAREAGLKVDL